MNRYSVDHVFTEVVKPINTRTTFSWFVVKALAMILTVAIELQATVAQGSPSGLSDYTNDPVGATISNSLVRKETLLR